MKKSLLFILLFLAICPCFSSNSLQSEDERKFINSVKNEYNLAFLIHNDYEGYLEGKDSMYGAILNNIDSFKDKTNLKYSGQLKDDYDCYKKYYDKTYCGITSYKIDDSEYIKLNTELKGLITGFNFIFNK